MVQKTYRHLCVGELHNIQVIQPERHRCAYRWLNEAICSVITPVCLIDARKMLI